MIPQVYFDKVKNYFGDAKKAWTWFYVYNVNLGNSPIQMIRDGHGNKLMDFIDSSLDDNFGGL